MQIHFICVGQKMPAWVVQGYDEYAKRLPRECELRLKEIAAGKRTKNSCIERIIAEEGDKMLNAAPAHSHFVSLDLAGKAWSTQELSQALQRWQGLAQPISLFVGGPDGLADTIKQQSAEGWALSPLTFPHPLVRVIVAEQIYRAWSLLQNHPYHR